MPKLKVLFIVLPYLFLTACSNTSKLESTENFRQNFPQPHSDITPSIILYADNQEANVLAQPITEQSKISEWGVNTAHRYPALDAYALDLVDYINQKHQVPLIIHGGDALNNSCYNEYEKFVSHMNNSKKEWYLAPGNHDGFYLGISSPNTWSIKGWSNLLDERAGWADACTSFNGSLVVMNYEKGMRNIMDKFSFVQKYVDTIGVKEHCKKETDNCFEPNDSGLNLERLTMKCTNGNIAGRDFLKEICWTINKEFPDAEHNIKSDATVIENAAWKHFVIQLIQVPSKEDTKHILLIDTASYGDNIAVDSSGKFKAEGYGAADNAHFSEAQLITSLKWVKTKEYNVQAIIGHHPLEDFDLESIERFATLSQEIQKNNNTSISGLFYISGDTHDGYDLKHSTFKPEQYSSHAKEGIDIAKTKLNIREINLGALIDAPIEYALLGTSIDNNLHINRYSLTPLIESPANLDSKVKLKTSKQGNHAKTYALIDELWGKCESTFPYTADADRANPLGLTGSPLFDKELYISQPYSYLGSPYVINFISFSPSKTAKLSLLAYKINRLIDLANVNQQQALYSKNVKLIDNNFTYQNKVTITRNAIIELKNNNFTSYLDDYKDDEGHLIKNTRFNNAMGYLEELITYQNTHESETDIALEFRRCAALYEAEREYRTGFMDKF